MDESAVVVVLALVGVWLYLSSQPATGTSTLTPAQQAAQAAAASAATSSAILGAGATAAGSVIGAVTGGSSGSAADAASSAATDVGTSAGSWLTTLAGIGLTDGGVLDLELGGKSTVGGATTGAGIGTLIVPGIGTAIGAGIGAFVGWIFSIGSNDTLQDRETFAEKLGFKTGLVISGHTATSALDALYTALTSIGRDDLHFQGSQVIGRHDSTANQAWMQAVVAALQTAQAAGIVQG